MLSSLSGSRVTAQTSRQDSLPINVLKELYAYSLTEICYNFRHVQRNGRGRGDPWSLRQTGFYHSYNHETEQSVWIILQPHSSIYDIIQDCFRSRHAMEMTPFTASLILHAQILASASSNWYPYIEQLWSKLDDLVSWLCTRDDVNLCGQDEKASFSKVGKSGLYDYPLEFSDIQSLHRLYGKFQRTLSALDSMIEVLHSYQSFRSCLPCPQSMFTTRIEELLAQARGLPKKGYLTHW